MTYCNMPDYYDANTAANAFVPAKEEPTRCDCGEVTKGGNVYCDMCLRQIKEIMEDALDSLKRCCEFTEEQANEAFVYWVENEDVFEEVKC